MQPSVKAVSRAEKHCVTARKAFAFRFEFAASRPREVVSRLEMLNDRGRIRELLGSMLESLFVQS